MASRQKGDPRFVRLPQRLLTGCLGDVESGFFIGGRDVVPMPDAEEDPRAYAFVKTHLRAGNLENASHKEHAVVSDAREEMSAVHVQDLDEREAHDRPGHQEQRLQALAARTTRKLDRLRFQDEDDEDDEEETAGAVQYRRTDGGGTKDDVGVQTTESAYADDKEASATRPGTRKSSK